MTQTAAAHHERWFLRASCCCASSHNRSCSLQYHSSSSLPTQLLKLLIICVSTPVASQPLLPTLDPNLAPCRPCQLAACAAMLPLAALRDLLLCIGLLIVRC